MMAVMIIVYNIVYMVDKGWQRTPNSWKYTWSSCHDVLYGKKSSPNILSEEGQKTGIKVVPSRTKVKSWRRRKNSLKQTKHLDSAGLTRVCWQYARSARLERWILSACETSRLREQKITLDANCWQILIYHICWWQVDNRCKRSTWPPLQSTTCRNLRSSNTFATVAPNHHHRHQEQERPVRS